MSNIKSEEGTLVHRIPVIDKVEKKLKYVECEATVADLWALRRTNYVFHTVKNLMQGLGTYSIVHLESGYMLASAATEKDALKLAQDAISELPTLSDIGTRIIFQKKLNQSFASL